MNKLAFPICILFAIIFIYSTAMLPDRADINSPSNLHVSPTYIEHTEEDIGIENVVSAVLADYRGYDTLGETFVIFTAGIAVLAVMSKRNTS